MQKNPLHSRVPVVEFSHASELSHQRRLQHANPKRRVCLGIWGLARRARKKLLARTRRSRKLTLWQTQTHSLDSSPFAAEENTTSTPNTASKTKPQSGAAPTADATQSLSLRQTQSRGNKFSAVRRGRSCRTWATITWTCSKSLDTHTLNP